MINCHSFVIALIKKIVICPEHLLDKGESEI